MERHTFVTHPGKWHVNVLSILDFATQHINFWGISRVHVHVMWRPFCLQMRHLCAFTWPFIWRVASCVNTIYLKILSSSLITFSILLGMDYVQNNVRFHFQKTWLVGEQITLNLICLNSRESNYYDPPFLMTIHIYIDCCKCKWLGEFYHDVRHGDLKELY